jgi:putative transposase
MSRKYKIRNDDGIYFVTFTVIRWLDVFTRTAYKDIFIESLRFCQRHKGLELYAYCIMTNHVHLIIGRNGKDTISALIRDIKKFTSLRIIGAIQHSNDESRKDMLMWFFAREGRFNPNNKEFQFWQQYSHPVELATNEMIDQRLEYVHNNPVRAGIVLSPEHYLYSSAINYVGLPEQVIPVTLL